MNNHIKIVTGCIGIILTMCSTSSFGQVSGYPYAIDEYPFIHYEKNEIDFYHDSSAFEQLFAKFDSVYLYGTGQVNIVHLGGSHLQADIYSHRLRQRLQTFMPGSNGGRGMVFPYRIAKTNNPRNYRVTFQGDWDYSKNTKRLLDGPLGLMGIKVRTHDTTSRVHLSPNTGSQVNYDFNKVRIYHAFGNQYFDPGIEAEIEITDTIKNHLLGFTEYHLSGYSDTLQLCVQKTDRSQLAFELYGIQLMTDDPGIVYHAVGVNGASLPSFNRCEKFVDHMKAVDPDLVVISIGTNDGNTRFFKPKEYHENYDTLLHLIREAAPNAALLLTVPNDSYMFRRYINKNTAEIEEEIIQLATEYGGGVWDFYRIMGGLNSIYVWNKEGLARYDKIHFTRKGYELKGDLLFNALLKAYDNHLNILVSEKEEKFKKKELLEAKSNEKEIKISCKDQPSNSY